MNTKEFDKYFVKAGLRGFWAGAQPANFIFQFPFQGPQFIVFNTDESGTEGSHWVAMFVPFSGPIEFFDPLGRRPESYQSYFRDWLISSAKSYMRNEWRYQDYGTPTCGEFCVYFGVKRLKGETMREILKTFDARNLFNNEIIVHDYVCNLI